ncbi:MAG: hypothetical protein JKY54_01610 [Flavobacteriales bacterium]|nr:hypothetical protein [Flavobacteriales bacterium]
MASPWFVIPYSSRTFTTSESFEDIIGSLKNQNVSTIRGIKKIIVEKTTEEVVQFEPEGSSIFQPICTIKKQESQSYIYKVGISKSILHACIITSLFPIFPFRFQPEAFFLYIPLIWLTLIGVIYISSYKARMSILGIIQQKHD